MEEEKEEQKKKEEEEEITIAVQCSIAMQQNCTHVPRQFFLLFAVNEEEEEKEKEEEVEEEKEKEEEVEEEKEKEEEEEIMITMQSSTTMPRSCTRGPREFSSE